MKTPQIFYLAAFAALLHLLSTSAFAVEPKFDAGTDNFANASTITTADVFSDTTSLQTYTEEPGEPLHKTGGIFGARKSAWWKFTPTVDGYCTVDTLLTQTASNRIDDTLLGVYTGSTVSQLTRVGLSDDYNQESSGGSRYYSLISFYAKKGVTYHIAVDAYGTVTPTSHNVVLQLCHLPLKKATYIGNILSSSLQPGTLTYTTTPQGSFSGKISFQNKSYPISGAFSLSGIYTGTIITKTSTGAPNPLQVRIDGTQRQEARLYQLSTLEFPDGNPLSAALFEKKVFTPQAPTSFAGLYTAHMHVTGDAAGYLIINVKPNGTITAVGSAQDGTPLSFSSFICEPRGNETTPFVYYKSLLGGKATFLGNANLITDAGTQFVTSGFTAYIRQPNVGTLYPTGIESELFLVGSQYTKPAANTRALGFLDPTGAAFASVIADGIELNANVETLGTLSPQNKFTFEVNPQKLTLKLNPTNGLVTGTILLPNGKKSKIKALLARDGSLTSIQGLATGTTRNYPFIVIKSN